MPTIIETLILKILRSKRSDAFKMAILTKALNQKTELYLAGANLEDSEIIFLAKALEQNSTLVSLVLSSNKYPGKVGSEAVKALSKMLETNKTLTSLDLGCNHIGPESTKILAKALETNQSLTELNLATNDIGSEGVQAIAEALKKDTKLKTLHLSSNKIDTAGIQALSDALKINRTLEHLDLGGIDESANIESLATVLGTNQSSVTNLSLRYRIIDDNAAQALATALKTNKTLTNLDLGYTTMRHSDSIRALAQALMVNQTLRSLDLGSCDIDPIGAVALAEALKKNTALNRLSLQKNHIGYEGATAFANTLAVNQTLTSLDFYDAWRWDGGADVFTKALETNDTLKSLWLSETGITLEGVRAFEKVLKTNKSLVNLYLRDVQLHGYSGTRKTQINNSYLKRNRALPLKTSKQVDVVLESSSLIPPLVKIVKEYADLPDTSEANRKPNKITAFLTRLASQLQRFFRRIVQFFQRQWTNVKNKILTKESTSSDINKTSNPEQSQGRPPQTAAPSVPEKETITPKEPQATTTDPTQIGKKSRGQPRT